MPWIRTAHGEDAQKFHPALGKNNCKLPSGCLPRMSRGLVTGMTRVLAHNGENRCTLYPDLLRTSMMNSRVEYVKKRVAPVVSSVEIDQQSPDVQLVGQGLVLVEGPDPPRCLLQVRVGYCRWTNAV